MKNYLSKKKRKNKKKIYIKEIKIVKNISNKNP